jgi:hypothetical protein
MEQWLKTTETPPAEPKPKDDPAWLTWTKIALAAVVVPLGLCYLLAAGEPDRWLTALGCYGVFLVFGIVLFLAMGGRPS